MARQINKIELLQQIDWLIANFPELAEDEVLRRDTIEGDTDFIEYMRLLERRRQDARTLQEALELYVEELKQRSDRFKRRDEGMRALMLNLLQHAQLRRLELPEATISVRHGVPRVVITDEAELPGEFWRIKKEPDKIKLKQALEISTHVPGATLSNSPETLNIRIK
jgi:Siphovirus Gp157